MGVELLILLQQPFFGSPDGDLCSGVKAQLGKHVANVCFHRAFADDERFGHLAARLSARDSYRNFTLTFGQSIVGPLSSAPG